jgi:hypothetical protein
VKHQKTLPQLQRGSSAGGNESTYLEGARIRRRRLIGERISALRRQLLIQTALLVLGLTIENSCLSVVLKGLHGMGNETKNM